MLWRSRRLPLATRDGLKVLFYWVKFMRQKFKGTNPKYKNHSEHQLWLEYAHLKREFEKINPTASVDEYDRFIDRIVAELGI
jgi:hypothetical protein